jgi:hypothetical protein
MSTVDIVERLRYPAWAHSEAPNAFPSPQLEKEEAVADMNVAANEIERLRTELAALQGSVVVPAKALLWLNGEGPDADGKWFGECEGEVKRTPAYWWRSKFRSMIPNWPSVSRQDGKGGAA